MDRVLVAWYGWLSGLTQGAVVALGGWADRVELPLLGAVAFGLIGATSPCQLTTSLGALAYASAHPGGGRPLGLALAYVAGKITVYSLVGAGVVLVGLQLQAISIPVVIVARRALGPVMILIGLGLLGRWRFRFGAGQRLAWRLRERLRLRGVGGAYLLGVAFSFALCPTLFWLFFGLTVPLALRSAGGWTFPGLFAVGASLPLLAAAGLIAAGVAAADAVAGSLRWLERPLRVIAGAILVLAGLHDTLVYWVV
ncbi:MAG TPA: sulfite exporter TauE/SafE family protein [Methylomirabilota bacterium]|jgi:cytochrome c biogenesis protein CcdA|nr:sulfite exporter TauE/SafE family protein [Methylomirabilota bacterium]